MKNLTLKDIPNSIIIGAGIETVAEFGMWYDSVACPVFKLMSVDIKTGKFSRERCPKDIKTHSRKQFLKLFAWVLDAERNLNFLNKNLLKYKNCGLKNINFEQLAKDVFKFKNKYLDNINHFINLYKKSTDKVISAFYVTVDDKSVKSNNFDVSLYKRYDLDMQINEQDLNSPLAKNVRLAASKIFALNRVKSEFKNSNLKELVD